MYLYVELFPVLAGMFGCGGPYNFRDLVHAVSHGRQFRQLSDPQNQMPVRGLPVCLKAILETLSLNAAGCGFMSSS